MSPVDPWIPFQQPQDTTTGVVVPEPTQLALRYHRGNTVIWAVDVVLVY